MQRITLRHIVHYTEKVTVSSQVITKMNNYKEVMSTADWNQLVQFTLAPFHKESNLRARREKTSAIQI